MSRLKKKTIHFRKITLFISIIFALLWLYFCTPSLQKSTCIELQKPTEIEKERCFHFYWAAYRGDYWKIDSLLALGHDPNCLYQNRKNALWAVINNEGDADEKMFSYLIEKGADPKIKSNGRSLITWVTDIGYLQILLNSGVDCNSQDAKGITGAMMAARRSNLAALRLHRKYGAEFSLQDKYGNTIAHHAVENGNLEVIQYLLDSTEVDFNQKNNFGIPPSRFAYRAYFDESRPEIIALLKKSEISVLNSIDSLFLERFVRGKGKILDSLLKEGANPDLKDRNGHSIFSSMISAENYSCAKTLADQGASLSTLDIFGLAPLFSLAREGEITLIKHFIKKGMDLQLKNSKGESALHQKRLSIEMVEYLINAGLDPKQITEDGSTVLMFAARDANLELLNYYTKLGISLAKRDKNNRNALYYALLTCNLKSIEFLAQFDSSCAGFDDAVFSIIENAKTDTFAYKVFDFLVRNGGNFNVYNKQSKHAFITACSYCIYPAVKKIIGSMIKMGVDFNIRDDGGESCLHKAVIMKDRELAEELLKKGVNCNTTDYYGNTPLFYIRKDTGFAEMLIQNGADVTHTNNHGQTVLMNCAMSSNPENAELFKFFSQRCSLNLQDNIGKTALIYAAEARCDPIMIKNLLELGADATIKDTCGKTALFYLSFQYKAQHLIVCLANLHAWAKVESPEVGFSVECDTMLYIHRLYSNGITMFGAGTILDDQPDKRNTLIKFIKVPQVYSAKSFEDGWHSFKQYIKSEGISIKGQVLNNQSKNYSVFSGKMKQEGIVFGCEWALIRFKDGYIIGMFATDYEFFESIRTPWDRALNSFTSL